MTATLEEIHRDPTIIDRAIREQQPLTITDDGVLAATVQPAKRRKNPDFLARAIAIWGENPPGPSPSEIVSESRDRD